MQDQEPQYFTKFRVELHEKLDKRFDAHAEQIAHVSEEITVIKGELKEINTRLDGHAEQIAKVSEDLTFVKTEIKEIRGEIKDMKGDIKVVKGDIKDINKKIEVQGGQATEIISILNRKADTVYVDDINFRTKKLEKVAFA
jgi:chromosome segregation ATPase